MKIKYWIVIALLGASVVFLAGCPLLGGHEENNVTAAADSAKPSQGKSLELRACSEEARIKGDPATMDEQALRRYMTTCSGILLANESFAELDSTIAYLRNNKIRTPSGLWLQSLFYAGIEEYLGNVTTETGFMQTEESLRNWIAASSDPDAAHMAMSTLMIDKAFLLRGTGYAADVSEDSFKLFHQQISRTKKYLLEHEDIAARDPEWFTLMLIITRVEENSNEKAHRGYFDKAVKLYPDYYPIYFTASVFYLPKWNGEAGAFDKFVRDAAKNLSPGQAKAVYARTYWANVCSRCGEKDVADWRDHWSDLKAGFDQIIQDYPDQWNINNYARIACSAYDKDKTLELMKKIQGAPIRDAWNSQFSYEYCANWSGLSN